MSNSLRVVAIAIAFSILLPLSSRAADPAQAIEQRLRQWTEDFNAGRVDRLCDLFAPDLIANYRGQPEKSFDSLCTALREDITSGPRSFHYALELNEIMVSGDMAMVRLIWHLTVTDRETGRTFETADRGIDIFRLQPDGEWRIARYIAYEIEDE